MDENKKLYWDIARLKEWEKNPRNIQKDDFSRLKYQVKKLGQYKPLLVTQDGTVLGGNMRLKAYRELGLKYIWVSVVNPATEKEKIEYALSDNDRAGYYDEDMLAGLTSEFPTLDWDKYAVDLQEPQNINEILDELEKDEAPIEEKKEYGVIISAKDEKEEDELISKLASLGYTMKRLSEEGEHNDRN